MNILQLKGCQISVTSEQLTHWSTPFFTFLLPEAKELSETIQIICRLCSFPLRASADLCITLRLFIYFFGGSADFNELSGVSTSCPTLGEVLYIYRRVRRWFIFLAHLSACRRGEQIFEIVARCSAVTHCCRIFKHLLSDVGDLQGDTFAHTRKTFLRFKPSLMSLYVQETLLMALIMILLKLEIQFSVMFFDWLTPRPCVWPQRLTLLVASMNLTPL